MLVERIDFQVYMYFQSNKWIYCISLHLDQDFRASLFSYRILGIVCLILISGIHREK